MDIDMNLLYSIEQQYNEVDKEKKSLAAELKGSRQRRRLLDAEVKFLKKKLSDFRKNANQDEQHIRPGSHEGRLAVGHDQRPVYKTEEAPKFFEVEVKFVDLKAPGNGFIDLNAMHYSPVPHDR